MRDQRVPPFIFFGTVRLFLELFFPQRVPLQFLCCFATECPPFQFFGLRLFFQIYGFWLFDVVEMVSGHLLLRENAINWVLMRSDVMRLISVSGKHSSLLEFRLNCWSLQQYFGTINPYHGTILIMVSLSWTLILIITRFSCLRLT